MRFETYKEHRLSENVNVCEFLTHDVLRELYVVGSYLTGNVWGGIIGTDNQFGVVCEKNKPYINTVLISYSLWQTVQVDTLYKREDKPVCAHPPPRGYMDPQSKMGFLWVFLGIPTL